MKYSELITKKTVTGFAFLFLFCGRGLAMERDLDHESDGEFRARLSVLQRKEYGEDHVVAEGCEVLRDCRGNLKLKTRTLGIFPSFHKEALLDVKPDKGMVRNFIYDITWGPHVVPESALFAVSPNFYVNPWNAKVVALSSCEAQGFWVIDLATRHKHYVPLCDGLKGVEVDNSDSEGKIKAVSQGYFFISGGTKHFFGKRFISGAVMRDGSKAALVDSYAVHVVDVASGDYETVKQLPLDYEIHKAKQIGVYPSMEEIDPIALSASPDEMQVAEFNMQGTKIGFRFTDVAQEAEITEIIDLH